MKPAKTSRNSILSIIAAAASAPPRAMDPVSPMKSFAGFLLKIKNPRQTPLRDVQNTNGAFCPICIAIIAKKIETMDVTPLQRPSRPSVKFTLFAIATTTKITKGM